MGWGKFRKKVSKAIRKVSGNGILGIVGMGKGGLADKTLSELGHGAGYITGQNAMNDLLEAQEAANRQAEANAKRQASINAGNVQQASEAGTESALSKILKKRTALQRSIRTAGQQRLGD